MICEPCFPACKNCLEPFLFNKCTECYDGEYLKVFNLGFNDGEFVKDGEYEAQCFDYCGKHYF